MNAFILKSSGKEQFRFGNGSKNDASIILHSDTLFSGFINIYDLIYGNSDEIIQKYIDGKFTFSSAFPAIEDIRNEKIIYFLPKPLISFQAPNLKTKDIKKISFISFEVYKLISNNLIIDENNNIICNIDLSSEDEFVILDRKFCLLKNEISSVSNYYKPYVECTFPKVFVNTLLKKDTFYYETNILLNNYYEDNELILQPHYYFIYNLTDTDSQIKQKIYTCFRILCDEGFGGERSTGKGYFRDIIEKDIPLIEGITKYFLSLSLINPKNLNEYDAIISYDILKRGGGSLGDENSADYHRKQVNMVAEGSIINGIIDGRIVDVSPEKNFKSHSIIRNGKALLIPFGG